MGLFSSQRRIRSKMELATLNGRGCCCGFGGFGPDEVHTWCLSHAQPKAASVSKSMIHSFVRFAEPCIRVVVVLVLCSPTITLWKGTNGGSDSGRGPVPQPALRWLAATARNVNGTLEPPCGQNVCLRRSTARQPTAAGAENSKPRWGAVLAGCS